MTTTTLTDAELLRLEELAAKATPGEWYESVTGEGVPSVNASAEDAYHCFSICIQGMIYNTYNTPYIAASCNAAPSLVAEVRALRRHNQAMRGGNKFVRDSLQAENAALRERVEALEWLVEVRDYDFWNSKPDTASKFTPQFGNASREYDRTYYAAREAIK